jgi:hypothetical protein
MSLKIGSVAIPFVSGFDIRQTYDELSAKTILRSKSGAAILQSRWQKLKSTISGSSWLPAAIDSIDKTVMQTVSCVAPLSVFGATTTITIPRTFRTETDYAPQAIAIVNGEMIETTLSLAGSVCTLAAVSGATQYQVVYYPIITGVISINKDHDTSNQLGGWTIELEEQ